MKVYFAGEGIVSGAANDLEKILHGCGVNYRLKTFYDVQKRGQKISTIIDNEYRSMIIDSGLFTFMFGADKEIGISKPFCEKWLDEYCAFGEKIFACRDNIYLVEMDVQKKIGADYAWQLREKMWQRFGKEKIMNAYHLEDGCPDELIAASKYIAIGMPELRFAVDKKKRLQITAYIALKAKKAGKRVHLLGCTEKEYLKLFSFCDTCDSTSWQKGFRYGHFSINNKNMSHSQFMANSQIQNDYTEAAKHVIYSLLQEYTKLAGNQN